MFNLIELKSLKDLRALVEETIEKGANNSVLYVSPFNKISSILLDKLKANKSKKQITIYVVNSWDLPEAFNRVHPVTQTPTLVNITKSKDYVIDYVPNIYAYFGV